MLINTWNTNEQKSKEARYDRLAKLVKDEKKRPYWLNSVLENNLYITEYSDKWKVIESILKPSPEPSS